MNENTEQTDQDTPKRTKVEFVEAMKKLYTEIQSITEEIDSIKEEAKTRGMPATLMAKVAKLQADMKVDDVLDKNEEFAALVEEVRG
jgi:uncharacterized protein (UPF0335 family)